MTTPDVSSSTPSIPAPMSPEARQAVPSYSGVPVLDNAGKVVGTLRHYDLVPRDTRQVDIPLMLSVASCLTLGGHVPPCPEN